MISLSIFFEMFNSILKCIIVSKVLNERRLFMPIDNDEKLQALATQSMNALKELFTSFLENHYGNHIF